MSPNEKKTKLSEGANLSGMKNKWSTDRVAKTTFCFTRKIKKLDVAIQN